MSDAKLNLNQASPAELAELPGIGEKLAEKIVAYREKNQSFLAVADLATVPGISSQMVNQLEEYLTVHADETAPDSEGAGAGDGRVAKKTTARRAQQTRQEPVASQQQFQELRTAARAGDVKKVKTFLKKNRVAGRDKFALLWAAQGGHQEVVTELIQAGADVNCRSVTGGPNPLALAAQNGYLEVVQTLIQAGAEVNEPAIHGWTPLMKAAFFGHGEIVDVLLEAGAETHIRDIHGHTAADLARLADNQQLSGLLER